jgi:hypothetical protein
MTVARAFTTADAAPTYALEVEGTRTGTRATKAQALEAAERGLVVALWEGSFCVFKAWPAAGDRAPDPLRTWIDLRTEWAQRGGPA